MEKMKIKVIPNSKFHKIEFKGKLYKVFVKEKTKHGQANQSIIALLEEKTGKRVRIIGGFCYNIKTVVLTEK